MREYLTAPVEDFHSLCFAGLTEHCDGFEL